MISTRPCTPLNARLVLSDGQPFSKLQSDHVALRQAMERLASEKLLCDLTLELETGSALFSHALSSFESLAAPSIAKLNPVRPKGPTPDIFRMIATRPPPWLDGLAVAILCAADTRTTDKLFSLSK